MGAAAGGIIGGASMFGSALMNKGAASSGASMTAMGQLMAAQIQQQMFQQVNQNSQPYLNYGSASAGALTNLLGLGQGQDPTNAYLTARFQPTMQQLQNTPGYQFQLQQGLNATQNSYAAQGLGSSGNALMGAANYAEGLASTSYQQQLQNYMAQNLQQYNMLNGGVGAGLQANNTVANAAGTASTNIGNSLAGAGQAYGQGQIASTAALTNPLSQFGAYAAMNPQFQNSLSSMSGGMSNFVNNFGSGINPMANNGGSWNG
jgi:hypothetical protein